MHSSKMWSVLFRIWFGTSLDITSSIRCNSYLPDCTDFFFSFFFANSAHLCEFHLQWSPASQPAKLDRSWRRKLFGRTHKMAASLQIEPCEDFFFCNRESERLLWHSHECPHLLVVKSTFDACATEQSECETQRRAQSLASVNRSHFGHACMSCCHRPAGVRRR